MKRYESESIVADVVGLLLDVLQVQLVVDCLLGREHLDLFEILDKLVEVKFGVRVVDNRIHEASHGHIQANQTDKKVTTNVRNLIEKELTFRQDLGQ